jgi:hypothetical protein
MRRVVGSVFLALVVMGCAGDDDPAAVTTTAAPRIDAAREPVRGLVAELGTNRLYVVDRAFGLSLRNVGDEPVVVRQAQLVSSRFATVPPSAREVTLQPGGQRFVLPLPYGEVRCDGEPEAAFPVVLVVDEGEELRLEVPEEYDGAVARLHARECKAAEVRERVDITFGDAWAMDGITISGELRLDQRTPGEPVAIDDAVGNVLFTLLLEQAHPVLRVTDEAPSARVPVTISADRCDPHAVAEFKQPYRFLAWVTLGDDEPVPIALDLTGGARAALDALIASCST